MADRCRGHERRFSDAGACSHPSAESLTGRLDELDIRVRLLEEKQSLPESYFAADLRRAAARHGQHHQCKSLSSVLDDVRLKGTLMDRLHLLERRIRELSSELDKGARELQAHKSKAKDMKGPIDAVEKRAGAACRNERRRAERARIYRRWFPVGC